MKYIIGSGWWCAEQNNVQESEKRVKFGTDDIRGVAFHSTWYDSLCHFTRPEKIIIVDSFSPVTPDLAQDDRLEFVSLNENAGHSVEHKGKYSGWMRSVLVSMNYALNCDCDYYVYVEQDVLLFGKNIIEHEIKLMKKPWVFGGQKGLVQPLQQSFFIVKQEAIETFLSRIYSIKAKDSLIPPERKFAIATSGVLSRLPEFLFWYPKGNGSISKFVLRCQTALIKVFSGFGCLKSGFGRERPIDFDQPYFYFQHGTKEELEHYSVLLSSISGEQK